MAVEIERKFLLKNDSWREEVKEAGTIIRQGYMYPATGVVRIRTASDKAFLTLKGPGKGIIRSEFEYEIPLSEANEMLNLFCPEKIVEKTRYKIMFQGKLWEIDEFTGQNSGLAIAEIELDSEDESFESPEWLGKEVSDQPQYLNSNLASKPFSKWQ